MYVTLPFCHLHLVHGQNNPLIHIWTVPAHENTACDFESKHQQIKKLKNVNYTKFYHNQILYITALSTTF